MRSVICQSIKIRIPFFPYKNVLEQMLWCRIVALLYSFIQLLTHLLMIDYARLRPRTLIIRRCVGSCMKLCQQLYEAD
jgi:hypothetical protein